MNKNLFKRVICLVIALMMIMPNMPMGMVMAEDEIPDFEEQGVETQQGPINGTTTGPAIVEEPPAVEIPGDQILEDQIPIETANLTINHFLLDGYETLSEVNVAEFEIGETLLGEDLVSKELLDLDLVYKFSEPEQITIVEEENIINLYYGIEFYMGENSDGLSGQEFIESPDLVEYADGELGPFPSKIVPMRNNLMSFGMGVLSHPSDHNNIEWPAPGALDIDKTATPVEGYTNRWKVELTLEGKDIPKTSDIVLVIDRSGSMRGDKLSSAQTAATSFVNTLLDDTDDLNTRIAVVSFATGVTVHNESDPFKDANNKQDLIDEIDDLNADGGTHTQAGIRQANLLLNGSNADYKNIVLLSDGQPTFSYAISNVYNRLNSTYFVNTSGNIWHSRDDLATSAFDYSTRVGDGGNLMQYIGRDRDGWWDDYRYYYYNNGNSAVAEAANAKTNKTIYTIALDAGTDGNDVLGRVASPGKAYTGSASDLQSIFQTIAGSISYAATNATIIDPVGEKFSIPGINFSNFGSHIHVNRGTVSWDDVTETITWELDTISEGNPATMWYIVEIDSDAVSGVVYPTNGHTYVGYENALGDDAQKTFPEPEVGINAGTIKIHYYRVNAEGKPINSSGVEVLQMNQAELQVLTYMEGTPLVFNNPYSVDGPATVAIGGVNYQYNSASTGHGGDTNPTTVTLTPAQPSQEVWLGYMEVTDVTVTFNENYAGAPANYDRTTNYNTSLGSSMPGDPTRTGYNFSGWNTNSDGSGDVFTSGTVVTGDITVYAQWAAIDYKIYYNANTGGANIEDPSNPYNYDDEVTVLANSFTNTGYTFVEWNTKADGTGTAYDPADTFNMPAEDVTLYAQWAAIDYKIYYNANTGGASIEDPSNPYNYDDEVTVLANSFTNTGYTFVEWNTKADGTGTAYDPADTFNMPAEDVTLYAQWAAIDYKIYYNANTGGASIEDPSNPYNYDDEVTVLANSFTNTGYTFVEWNTKADGTGTAYDPADTFNMPAEDVTLYAQWAAIDYKIYYNANTGGASIEDPSNPYNYDDEVTVLANSFTNTGYTFVEWNTKADGTGTAYDPADTFNMPAEDVTLYAQWAAIDYKIYYNANTGGASIEDPSNPYNYDDEVTVLANSFTNTGYTFVEWNTKADGTGTAYDPADTFNMPAEDVTLYAQWAAIDYKIYYNANTGGASIEDPSNPYNYDDEVTVLANSFTNTGYTFVEWNTKADGTGTAYDPADTFNMPAEDVTLYAQWAAIDYKIYYNANTGGANIEDPSNPYNYDDEVTVLANSFTNTGYTFVEWNTKADGTGTAYDPADTFNMPAEDVTLYAQWAAIDYKIYYNANTGGASIEDPSNPYNYDDEVTVLANSFTNTGYTFVEWNTKADGTGTAYDPADTFNMPAEDVTLYAQWAAIDYKIYYNANTGGANIEDPSNPYNYDDEVTVLANSFTNTGYTFVEWNTKADGTGTAYDPADTFNMPAEDVTLYAQWAAIDYKIYYNANTGGASIEDPSNPYNYDDEVTVLANSFTNTGYTFVEWNTKADGTGTAYDPADTFNMPAEDVTLYAQWAAIDYKIYYNANTGGASIEDPSNPYNYDDEVTVLANSFTNTGYTFVEWNTKADGTGTAYDPADTFNMPAEDVTLYAQWAAIDYKIYYNANTGGANIEDPSNPYNYDDEVTVLANSFTNTGYTFVEWNTKADGTGTAYDPADTFNMPAEDVTLYAQWAAIDYKIYYNANTGGASIEDPSNPYNYDDEVTVLANSFTNTGYTFVEWNTKADGTGTAYDPADTFNMPAEDVTLYAQWAAIDYKIYYNANTGGANIEDPSNPYNYDDEVTVLANSFTNTGYTFVEWNTKADGTGTAYDPADTFNMPAEDVTLYAQWAGLEVSKTGEYVDVNDDGIANVGDKIDYTVTVENTGNVTLTNVSVTDPLITLTLTSGDTNGDGKLDVGETWVYTGSYNITQADINAGEVLNKVTADTEETPPVEDEEETPLEKEPGLAVSKTGEYVDVNDDGIANVGDKIDYTVTVENTGNVTLTNVSVTDPLITLTLTSGDTNGDGKLDVGETWVYTGSYNITQADINAGEVLNKVTADTEETPPVEDEEETPLEKEPGLAVSKTGEYVDVNDDGIANVGDKIDYTVTVENTGNVTLTNVSVTDPLITLTLTSGDTNGDGKLDVGETWVYTGSYNITQADINAGEVLNKVTADTEETPPVEDEEETPLEKEPGLAVSKTGEYVDVNDDGIANVGDKIDYTVTVENTGNVTLTNVSVTDPLITLTLTSGDTNGDGKLDVGETWVYTGSYNITQADINAGEVLNKVTADTEETPPVEDEEETPLEKEPGLAVSKTGEYVDVNDDGIANVGDKIDYTVTVENTGNVTLTNVSVTDPLITLTLTSGDTNGDGKLDVGETWVYTGSYNITQADINAGEVLNKVTADTEETPPVEDEEETPLEKEPGLAVSKTGEYVDVNDDGIANVGDKIDYTVTVENTGNVTLTNVSVTDPLITLTLTSGDTNGDGKLDVGETWVYTGSYNITQADINAGEVLNKVTADTEETPPVEDEEETPLEKEPGLAVSKTGEYVDVNDDGIANVGDKIDYTVTVENTGNVTLTNVSVTDPLITLTLTSGDTNGDGKLDVGETWVYTGSYNITQADINAGEVLNKVTADTEETPPVEDEEETPLEKEPGLAVSKTGEYVDVNDDGIANVGDKIDYTVTVENTGNVTLTNVSVTDPLITLTLTSGDTNGDGKLDVGETWVYTGSYNITQADINAGEVLNKVTADTEETPPVEDEEETPLEKEPGLAVSKTGEYVDVNDDGIANVGDKIDYTVTVENTGNVTLTNVSVTDPLITLTLTSGDTNGDGKLDVGETWVYTGSYNITQADINAGEVLNKVTADTEETPPVEDEEETPLEKEPGLAVSKTGEYVDVNDDGIANVGDKIDYTVTVENTGNVTLTNVSVTDPLITLTLTSGDTNGDGKLDVGETWVYTGSYNITQADINAGEVLNKVTADTEETPPVEDEEETPLDQNPDLEVSKEGTWIDANQDGFADIGEVIDYTITVKNIGNVTITNLTVTDPMFGEGPLALDSGDDNDNGALDVGETWIFTGSYEITREDLDAEKVINTALIKSDQTDEEEVTEIVPLIEGFVVKYDSNGGTGTMIDSENPYASGDTVTVLANAFTRSSYNFTGWNTEANGSGTAYAAGATFEMPAEDVTLYAQWSRKSDPGPGPGPGPIVIPDPEPPLAELEKFDHFAYVIGYPEGDVRPLNNITREEVAMIFYRLLTDESRNALLSDVNPFTDMDQHHAWSNRAVSTLYNAGIISGYPEGTFRPSDPITRAEFATIAAKFDELDLGSASEFSDIFGHWAEKYITSSENKGWIKGYPDMTFKPEQDITRAEAMTLINNVLERGVPAENIHPDAIFWPDNPETEWYYEAVMEATNSHDYVYEDDGDELWTGMKPNKVWP